MRPIILFLSLLVIFSCSNQDSKDSQKQAKIVIGLSLSDLKEERWQRDRDLFIEQARSIGANVLVQDAGGDASLQIEQSKNLLIQGIDVLVIVPKNAQAAAPIVKKAQEKGVKVISYDRLIAGANPDLYISFDNYLVGEIQASEIMKVAPSGKYLLLGGDPADQNSSMLRDGQMKVLKGAIEAGQVEIVADPYCDKWQRSEATRYTEDALTKHPDIVAIVASNDGTASGAIAALASRNRAGKVFVSGQDADLEALRNIVKGNQTITVYKPIRKIAAVAAQAAVLLAKGSTDDQIREEIKEGRFVSIKNGDFDTPTIFLSPIPVNKLNIEDSVIADGFHTSESIYQ